MVVANLDAPIVVGLSVNICSGGTCRLQEFVGGGEVKGDLKRRRLMFVVREGKA